MLFPKATVIMFHTLGSLKNIGSFSHSFGGRSPKSGCWHNCAPSKSLGRILLRLFLASGGGCQFLVLLALQLYNSNLCLCLHLVSSSLCVCFYMMFAYSFKNTRHIGLGFTQMISSSLHYICNGLSSK